MGNLKTKIMNMTLLTSFLAGSAWAADKEISLDTGILGSSSQAWDMVGGSPVTIGLSGYRHRPRTHCNRFGAVEFERFP
jgi:hypothetical protein